MRDLLFMVVFALLLLFAKFIPQLSHSQADFELEKRKKNLDQALNTIEKAKEKVIELKAKIKEENRKNRKLETERRKLEREFGIFELESKNLKKELKEIQKRSKGLSERNEELKLELSKKITDFINKVEQHKIGKHLWEGWKFSQVKCVKERNCVFCDHKEEKTISCKWGPWQYLKNKECLKGKVCQHCNKKEEKTEHAEVSYKRIGHRTTRAFVTEEICKRCKNVVKITQNDGF